MENKEIIIKRSKYNLNTIKENYEEGRFIIPVYQRGYIWNAKQRGDLIDSFIKEYPIGTILVWRQPNSNYILDGQQRTRSLLRIAEHPFTDFSKQTLIDVIKKNYLNIEIKIIPNILNNLSSLSIEDLTNKNKSSDYTKDIILKKLQSIPISFKSSSNDIDKLAKFLSDYVLRLSHGDEYYINSLDIIKAPEEDVIKIFSRINTSGTMLTKFEILSAYWSSDKIKIRNEDLKKIMKNLYDSHNDFSGLKREIRDNAQNTPGELIYSLLFSAIFQTEIFSKMFLCPSRKDGISFLNEKHLEKLLWFIRAIIYVEEIETGSSKDDAKKIFNADNIQDLLIGKKIAELANKEHEQHNIDVIVDRLTFSMKQVEQKISVLKMQKSSTDFQKSNYIFENHSANLLISLAAQIYIEKSSDDEYQVNKEIQYCFLLEILNRNYSSSTIQIMSKNIQNLNYTRKEVTSEMIKNRIDLIELDHRNNSSISKGFSEVIQIITAIAFLEYKNNKIVNLQYDHIVPHAWLKKHKLLIGMNSLGNCGFLDALSNQKKSSNFNPENYASDQLPNIANDFKNNAPLLREYQNLLYELKSTPIQKNADEIYEFRWRYISKRFLKNIKPD